MARTSGKKDDLIKCEYCGEMYSTTYKHCPFCNEDGTGAWDESEGEGQEAVHPVGGKRLAYEAPKRSRKISPWSVLGIIFSLALIIAAICIVASIFRSITGRGNPTTTPTPTPTPPFESETVESAEPTPTEGEEDPGESAPVVEATLPPEVIQPTSFTLNKTDMSFFNPGELYDLKVRLEPEDAEAEVTWTSSDPNVASVSWNGRVTAISGGTVTVTASIEGVGEKTCIVRCQFSGSAPSSTGTTSSANGLTLSREDFTLAFAGDSWRLVVSGTNSEIAWASSNEAVATVSSNGTVTAVAKGTCTVTATVDGVTLSCIVRCNWSS